MKLTPERLTAFCAALAETCNVGRACKAVNISRPTAYEWRENIPEFAKAWDKALKIGVSALEDEAHRRAFEGINKPLVHLGRFTTLTRRVVDPETNEVSYEDVLDESGQPVVASTKEYSDTLAIFLLKAHDPEKYRDNAKLELAGHLALGDMSEEEIREELAQMVADGVIPATLAGLPDPEPAEAVLDDDDGSDLV